MSNCFSNEWKEIEVKEVIRRCFQEQNFHVKVQSSAEQFFEGKMSKNHLKSTTSNVQWFYLFLYFIIDSPCGTFI